ncbi:MAG TPA: 23S rRNA (pseudouridine(1915)-N(3))-methyltransferase RlmH [Methanoregulaceae archaeon]|nr:23S rRNA (pseudouridine(1915)-N(3))-methyltransferase RlmH [Methanoregulaceae archaeon]
MQIRIIAVGKIKEGFLREGIAEYFKRLRTYCRLEIHEVQEEKLAGIQTEKEAEILKLREAEKIRALIPKSSFVIVLDMRGKSWTSQDLATRMASLELGGENQVTFIIGGATGLSESIRDDADIILSLSRMTLTHQMARLILLEQIYRAFRICRGEPYHK